MRGSRVRGSRVRGSPVVRKWLWRWLGLAALVAVGGLLLKRPRSGSVLPPASSEPSLRLPPGAETAWIQGPGGSLRIGEVHRGAALAILFVHGLGGRLEQWSALLSALGPGVHGIAFDLPGHGGSEHDAAGDYSTASLAAAIAAVLDGLGLRSAVIVAHSVGATAAIELAGRHPGRVAGLLLVDPTGDQTRLPAAQRQALRDSVDRDPGGDLRWNFRQLLVDARPEVADHVLESADSLAEEVIRGILESGLDHSPLPALESYGGAVRSLQSERNDLPWSLHRLRPEMPHRFLYGASHWLMMDRPQEVWEELVALLEELSDRGGLDRSPAWTTGSDEASTGLKP